jgi:diaminopropionate ammonia-lyase
MFELFSNPRTPQDRAQSLAAAAPLDGAAVNEARAVLGGLAGFAATPLVSLGALAEAAGVATLLAKDERERLGLGSFKALGGTYAALTLAQAVGGGAGLTFTTATAGNHGRAVAFGAALAGARSVVFVYDGVPEDQIAAIAGLGAEIVRVEGRYEAALAACVEQAGRSGWTVVSDVAWPGYEAVPTRIMQGYGLLASEALAQAAVAPTHVFLQAGVGGLAGAVAGHFAVAMASAPKVVVVEPRAAPCLFESARAGRMVEVAAKDRTRMGRLECYRPSTFAWALLSGLADAFMTIDDALADEAVALLAHEGLATSPSGAAGVAGLLAAGRDPASRTALGLGAGSRVLVVISERPTARDLRALSSNASATD